MTDVEELLDGVPVRLASAQAVRGRGERRRARQRTGAVAVAVVAAVAVGIGSWTGLSPGPRDAQVAAEDDNPFMSRDVVQMLKPSQLPRYEALRWAVGAEPGDKEATDDTPLPQAGLKSACNGRPGGIKAPSQQFTNAYHGKGGAVARYRVSAYDDTARATDATQALGQTLRDCGLRNDQDGHYTGLTNGTSTVRLEVSVRRWGTWVGVVETQWSPTT